MEASLESATRSQRVAQELDHQRKKGGLREIVVPPCPALLVRLQQAMQAPEPDLQAVASIAEDDVAMSATLLRNANGAVYAGLQPLHTVGQAMDRMGLDETAALMTAFLARHAIPVHHPQLRRFWDQATMRAQALRFMARQLGGLEPELGHAYGLFCHVGMPVLMQSVRGYGSTLVEAQARNDRSFIATENANHRTDHAVVGALVARTWRLSPIVTCAIRLHHDLSALGDADTEAEVHTLIAAGLVAEHLVRRQEGLDPEREWAQHRQAAMRWLQISQDDVDDLEQTLGPVLQPA